MTMETPLVPRSREECPARADRFLRAGLSLDEALAFACHLRDCFECRQYLDTLASILHRREWIRRQLQREELVR